MQAPSLAAQLAAPLPTEVGRPRWRSWSAMLQPVREVGADGLGVQELPK